MKLRFPYIVMTAGYCAIIFYLSSRADISMPSWAFLGADKAAHALIYGGLAATVWYGLQRSNETVSRGLSLGVPLVFAWVYGLSDEYHQLYVPGREFEWLDWLADGVGAAVAVAGLGYWDGRRSPEDTPVDS